MKTYNFKKLGLAVALAGTLGLTGCDTGFVEMNVDPNNPTSVPASNFLTQAQYRVAEEVWGRGTNFEFAMLMVQHFGQNEYAEDSRYNQSSSTFNGNWSEFYAGGLADINEAMKIVEVDETITEAQRKNQLAVLKIMRAYSFQQITDMWGDVPYSETMNSVEFPHPAYDSQETIYKDLIAQLTAASNEITVAEPGFNSGDIIYDGDMAGWKRFANSLKLRLAIRMSDVANADAETAAAEAIAAGVITSDAEATKFVFSSVGTLGNPFYVDKALNNRDDFCVTEVMVDHLQATNDPRLSAYAEMVGDTAYVGIPYGLTDADAFALKATTSRPANAILESTAPAILMSHSEVLFLEAEAIQRGYVAGDAAATFEAAIRANMAEWGVTDAAAIDNYVAANAYDAANWKQSLGEQKWVSLYTQGTEAWAEWRRLDYPVLAVPAAAVLPSIPVRALYPQDEEGKNSNFPGIKGMDAKVWWDVN